MRVQDSRDAARRVLALNTLEWAVLGTFASVSAVVLLAGQADGVPVGLAAAWLVITPVCAVLGVWIARPSRVERLIVLRLQLLLQLKLTIVVDQSRRRKLAFTEER